MWEPFRREGWAVSVMRWWALAVTLLSAGYAAGQDAAGSLGRQADEAVRAVMTRTGVPSASVGIVVGNQVVWTQAYGRARLEPALAADAAMAYPVGSISKQFTATCVLLLAEDGKLRLDDPVARWFPGLTRAGDVTVREILSHTSGYRDYAPQDYTIPAWTQVVAPVALVTEWAGKPLDFEPGTQWQYSNTNFVLAALIVERASGMPFMEFLRQRVLSPLGLTGVLDLDTDQGKLAVTGYERRALAALRPAKLEAPGWYFGDGALAMPVKTLLGWDVGIMKRALLKPASYEEFESAVKLKDGTATRYGLGISVLTRDGERMLEHSGEVGGFVAENVLLPERGAAVVVLTNQEASTAARDIAAALLPLVRGDGETAKLKPEEQQVRELLTGFQAGRIDRKLFTADANDYFSAETLGDFGSSLKPLGLVKRVHETGSSLRGGMTERSFEAEFADGTKVSVSTYVMKDGRLEQFLVEARR